MEARNSRVEIFVPVEYSCAEIERVAVGIAAGERRVVAVASELYALAVECTVEYAYLRSCRQSAAEQLETVGIVEVDVLVGEHTYVVVQCAKSKVVVAAHKWYWRVNVQEHALWVVLKPR